MAIDLDEMEELVERIDQEGKLVTVFIDKEGKLRTQRVESKNKSLLSGCKVVGIYDQGVSYPDLKADIDFAKAYSKERHELHLKTVKDALEASR